MSIDIRYIDNNKDFEEAIHSLSQLKQIFIDLEFDKNHFRYGFNLCLMQIFDGDSTSYLIDPLSDIDITKIFPLLEDENIQLVCYAFNEDMRLLHHVGATPKNILDLSIIIRLLDYDTLSLNNALITFLKDETYAPKKASEQKSNWCLRPLSEQQKIYAQKDVIFLPKLSDQLKKQISVMSREDWVKQEMKAFENYCWNNGTIAHFLTKKDQKQLSLKEWIRFKKLMQYREQLAQSINRPTYKVLDKMIILTIAKDPQLADIDKTYRGMHPKLQIDKVKETIQTILKEAEAEINSNNISIDAQSITLLSKEDKEELKLQKQRIQYLTDSFFLPLKEVIKVEYGIFFSNYFLSNRKIKDYATNEQRLLPYQEELVLRIANQLKLSIPQIFID